MPHAARRLAAASANRLNPSASAGAALDSHSAPRRRTPHEANVQCDRMTHPESRLRQFGMRARPENWTRSRPVRLKFMNAIR